MEEKAIILRSCIEFKPPIAPIIADKIAERRRICVRIGVKRT